MSCMSNGSLAMSKSNCTKPCLSGLFPTVEGGPLQGPLQHINFHTGDGDTEPKPEPEPEPVRQGTAPPSSCVAVAF